MRFEVTRCFVTRSCYCESHNGRPISFEMHSEQWEKCTIWEILMQFAASVCSDTFRGDVSTTELALASWFESKFESSIVFVEWAGGVRWNLTDSSLSLLRPRPPPNCTKLVLRRVFYRGARLNIEATATGWRCADKTVFFLLVFWCLVW